MGESFLALGWSFLSPHRKVQPPDSGSTVQRPSLLHKLQIYRRPNLSFGSGSATKATVIWRLFDEVITAMHPSFCHLALHRDILDDFFRLLNFTMFRAFQQSQYQTFCQGLLWNLAEFPKLSISHLASSTSFPFRLSLPVPSNLFLLRGLAEDNGKQHRNPTSKAVGNWHYILFLWPTLRCPDRKWVLGCGHHPLLQLALCTPRDTSQPFKT